MPQILHTTLHANRTNAAAGETFTVDLPTNPLSVILFTIKALNSTATLTNYSAMAAFFAKFTNLNVRYRGASIIDADSLDLAIMAALLQRWLPHQGQANATNGDARSVTFPLIFGRRAYDPLECFPATRRGDLVLEVTSAADPTGLDNFITQIETVELLDAAPERFTKITTTGRTMTLGSTNDIELPIGNKLLGALLRAATYPTAASYNSSFDQTALEVDNVEVGYSVTNWETLQGSINRRLIPGFSMLGHDHRENTAAAYTQYATTLAGMSDNAAAQQYGYIDLDPNADGMYALDTKGAASVRLSVNSDVADASSSYILPVELVEIAGGGPAV